MAAICLMVSFDINQESEKLNWSFLDAERRPISKKDGVETGLFVFEAGDTFELNVVAKSYDGQLSNAHIIDCHLITRPIMHSKRVHPKIAGEYPYPSPFFDPDTWIEGQGATASFGGGVASGSPALMSWDSPHKLTCRNEGRWQTSFIMTVAIETMGQLEYRVFSFDPETQVGTGAVPK
jgi:hypothetical protein